MSLDLSACSDGELAALSLAGRHSAFAEIMRRHRDPIYRVVRSHIGDVEEALDVTQECFLSAYRALRSYDPDRPFRAWISRIAINKCRDWGRRRAVRKFLRFDAPPEQINVIPDNAPQTDEALAERQHLNRLARAISILPSALKEPLILHTIEGLSQAETAAVLSISHKAVETRIARARAKLAEYMAEPKEKMPDDEG